MRKGYTIVDSDNQQAIINTWERQIRTLQPNPVFLNALARDINNLVKNMVCAKTKHGPDEKGYKKWDGYEAQKAQADKRIQALGLPIEDSTDYGDLLIFYGSVVAAILKTLNTKAM